jgi:conjugative transposon TraK protein
MFQSMKNIQSAFSHIRLFTIIICLSSMGVALYSVSKISDIAKMSKQQMLTIDMDGNLYQGNLSSRDSNIEIESKAHVQKFHQLFFSFDPEREIINNHKEQWVYLSDKSAMVQFDQLEEEGFYQNIIVSSISSRLEDVKIDIKKTDNPDYLTFELTGIQKLMRSSSVSYRKLSTSGRIRVLNNRSDNNSHGLFIENWKILDNSDLY